MSVDNTFKYYQIITFSDIFVIKPTSIDNILEHLINFNKLFKKLKAKI